MILLCKLVSAFLLIRYGHPYAAVILAAIHITIGKYEG
jgi:hypothetical protein